LAKDVGNADYHHLIDKNAVLKPYREKNRLSVMMVIKDEEATIFDAMMCVEPVADEYVVVDTGSTDKTIEEVERFIYVSGKDVRIIKKTFDSMEDGCLMNYSEAMNWAKAQCRYEWILRVDGDEFFIWSEVTNIFGFIEDGCDGYLFNVVNYLEPPRSTRPEDNKFSMSETIRLYRNIDELFYTGLLHESLEDATGIRFKNGKGRLMMSPISIHHKGYLKSKDRLRKKIERYHIINERQFEVSSGTDPRPIFNMALHMFNEDKTAEGVALYEQALKLSPTFWRADQNLGFYYAHLAKRHLSKASDQMPQYMFKGSKTEEILGTLKKFEFEQVKVG
jgi:glycosyltransferase involved in cell wall biosynthesis